MNKLLDYTILFSFDKSGFKRHCPNPLTKVDLSEKKGIVTGATSGIGLAVSKGLQQQGMFCQLIGRNRDKFEQTPLTQFHALDMSDLKNVDAFAKSVNSPIDLLVHNAGEMPPSLKITKDGFEQMFASMVLAPFILTKRLLESGKLKEGCRIIFVSSGGMYLQKLDLTDLLFQKNPYNKYKGYANAKRAQVILAKLFAKKYPEYLFSSMHPGWVDTPGVEYSMPFFKKLLNHRLRTPEEGADTILWLATADKYPNGKFWFDRKEVKPTILNFNQSTEREEELLFSYCESIYDQ